MLLSFIKSFDIFSQTFQFNQQKQRLRKRTLLGAFLTISIITLTIIYFIEILIEFFTNQIDPTFKNQTFIANGQINVGLNSNYFAYQLSQSGLNPIDELEKKENKTYVVALAQFVYQDNSGKKSWNLKSIQCQNPKLIGYNCLDFSNVPSNYTLALDNSQNIYSYVMVMLYRCQDTDGRKTSVPNNCASINEINKYINNPSTYLKVQIQVSQFNTTSKLIETCYRSQILLVPTSNIAISELKLQQQSTTVKQGAITQTSETFNSPISYTVNTQMFDPYTVQKIIGLNYFTQFHINLDEFQQYTSIQYPNLPQILAQCNSTLTLLMCLGILGRYFAQRLVRQDIFVLALKNIFQDSYSQVLGYENRLLDEQQFLKKSYFDVKDNEKEEDIEEREVTQSVFIPSFKTKRCESILSQISKLQDKMKDEIKEDFNSEIQQFDFNSQNYDNKSSIESKNKTLITINQILNSQTDEKSQKVNNDYDLVQAQFEDIQQSPIQKNITLFTEANYFNQQQIYPKKDKKAQIQEKKARSKDKKKIDERIQILFDQTASQNAQDKIFKFKLNKQEDYLNSLGLGKQDVQFIDQQVDNLIDFSKIIEDLTLLKKAIMIILNKDQLAVLKLVGCSKEFIKQEIPNRNFSNYKMSYFEEQFAISLSIEKQLSVIKQFITKCQTQNNLSIIDKRIYSSLL
ncbi:AMP-binding enzyme family protein (macronuclear) [Tetrahymena thermophila SB210]|uniref:AMP-binding enzyme family protein n=1 Tax=Tetrahymena thermophila (strain SB210) TaxID=312017 RepID=I7MM93_TETTS|nr:AMP-binding enzyme family protein [Tetrahymena thermophila SB210]EAS04400.2 AMP-binding enzyme family protein [Tetrahymena thermophila SB210]|eukprot:XP_001024645.2 AMP-binding enzyme family protein [Tetrahymena thermophila SB210]